MSTGIEKLYAAAQVDHDIASLSLLSRLAEEHVALEASIEGVTADLRRTAASDAGLLIIDRALGERRPK